MKLKTFSSIKLVSAKLFITAIFGLSVILSPVIIAAQTPELSLADLIIGLRSQKVTLPERNKILAEAVLVRGITFSFTAEIANELAAVGASNDLLQAIKDRSAPAPVPVATPVPMPVATPIPTPTPPGYDFYFGRAETNSGKGFHKEALTDYDKALEMKGDSPEILLARAKTHTNLKSFDRSINDYDSVIKLDPKMAIAYLNRGEVYELMGDRENALNDYKAVLKQDSKNEAAAAKIKKIEQDIAKEIEANKPKVERPAFLNVGMLTSARAVRLSQPSYPTNAVRSRIEGKVTIEIETDEEGNVVSAKAIDGPGILRRSAEDAAKASRFNPTMFDGTPIKTRGQIVYNFSLAGR